MNSGLLINAADLATRLRLGEPINQEKDNQTVLNLLAEIDRLEAIISEIKTNIWKGTHES